MKKLLILFIGLIMTFAITACSGGKYVDGSYTSEAKGNGGDIKLEVKVSSGKISEIKILENSESPEMISAVEGTLIPQIIKKQSTEGIDAVSGASNTSKAVLEAVGKVLKEHVK